MTNYQGNSKKSKGEIPSDPKPEKNLEKIVQAEVVSKKKPLGRRFKDIFFGGEFRNAGQYILGDVLLPAFRNLLVDATTEGVRRMVYGDSTQSRRRPPDPRGRVSYNSPVRRYSTYDQYEMRPPDQPPRMSSLQQPTKSSNELIFRTKEDAEAVLERVYDILDQYDCVSVADLHELVGLPSAHTDHKWGWTHLDKAGIRQTRDGFLLELPNPEPVE